MAKTPRNIQDLLEREISFQTIRVLNQVYPEIYPLSEAVARIIDKMSLTVNDKSLLTMYHRWKKDFLYTEPCDSPLQKELAKLIGVGVADNIYNIINDTFHMDKRTARSIAYSHTTVGNFYGFDWFYKFCDRCSNSDNT